MNLRQRALLPSVLSCLMCGAVAHAQNPASSSEIAPQSLSQALSTFAKQTGLQLVYVSDVAEGQKAKGIPAGLAPAEALKRLLEGTGLTFEFINDRTVRIFAAPAVHPTRSSRARSEAQTGAGARLAQSGETPEPVTPQEQGQTRVHELEEVLVTGSRLSRTAVEGPQEVKTYTREEIQRSGQATLTGFLNTLPEVSVAAIEYAGAGQSLAGQTTVRLRGMPQGTTLVLINGRRIADAGAGPFTNFFDLNNIPAGAIERVEVVPSGSSAVYGSDALAGVVNIILRRDMRGIEADIRYADASGTEETSASFAWGIDWSRGSLALVGSYLDRSELTGTERAITANSDYRAFGGPDRRIARCNPGNVYSTTGGNLPGLSSPQAGIPGGIEGRPEVSSFAATAGVLNLCSNQAEHAQVPASERAGFMAQATYDVLDSVQIFAELMYSHIEQNFTKPRLQLARVRVPAANPFNPFGQDVTVDYRLGDVEERTADTLTTNFMRPLIGARGSVFDSWHWELAAWEARTRSRDYAPRGLVNTANLNAALSSTDPATAVNLFASVPASEDVMATLFTAQSAPYEVKAQIANAFVRGPLVSLPSGELEVAVGAEYARNDVFGINPFLSFSFDRNVRSVFGELRAPLIANRRSPSEGAVLAATAAVRRDEYSDVGSATVPQFGLEWRPANGLLLRAAYGESFRAPGLFNVNGPITIAVPTVTDPLRNEQVQVQALGGGNPNLTPEEGRSRSFGVVWEPENLSGLHAAATYFQIDMEQRIGALPPQTIVTNEALFPGRVVRNPPEGTLPGRIVLVDGTPVNFGGLSAEGFDVDVGMRLETPLGAFSPRLSATNIYKFDAAITPNTLVTDRVSRATTDAYSPRWKGTAALGWENGMFAASVTGRYTGAYLDYQDLPNTNELGDSWIFDVNLSLDIGSAVAPGNKYFSQISFALGAVNVFDEQPPYSNFLSGIVGYDPLQYDIRGRVLYASLNARW